MQNTKKKVINVLKRNVINLVDNKKMNMHFNKNYVIIFNKSLITYYYMNNDNLLHNKQTNKKQKLKIKGHFNKLY